MPAEAVRRFGAQWRGGVTEFRLWAPACAAVTLECEGGADTTMQARPGGWHTATLACPPGTAYRFRLPDGLAVPDPAARAQRDGPHGWSLVTDPDAYAWRNTAWRGRPWHEAVIWECHAGLLGGFEGLRSELPRLAALGITAIELMPVADLPGGRNWGYDGVLPFAPAHAYGPPDAFKALIDDAHELGLMVLLDVVYNHFGPDGNYLNAYAPAFFRQDRPTPWGPAIAFDHPEVAAFFAENALSWLTEFRLDGLRLDAVQAIQPAAALQALGRAIRAGLPADRHVHLILENERNEAHLLAPAAASHAAPFDAQWNDDIHHCLHVLLTGEDEAYYADYAAAPAELLARCLREGFAYQGEVSTNLGHARGTPSAALPPTAFVACVQNHDQVGNRALGDRLTTLADPAALRAAIALVLLCPQVPMLFMGEETGSRSPFLFFTDHHDELADAVREGRRREFRHFAAFRDPQMRARIPDPNAASSYVASRPLPADDGFDWPGFYRALLATRARHLTPRLQGAGGGTAEVIGRQAVAAEWRMGDGARLLLAANLGAEPVALPAALARLPDSARIAAIPAPPLSPTLPAHSTLAWLLA